MTHSTPGDWEPCPPGELERLAERLAFQRRLRTAALVSFAALTTAGLTAAGWAAVEVAWSSPAESGCSTCCTGSQTEATHSQNDTPATKK